MESLSFFSSSSFTTLKKSVMKSLFDITSLLASATSQREGITSTAIYAYFAYLMICEYTAEDMLLLSKLLINKSSATSSFSISLCVRAFLSLETLLKSALTSVANSLSDTLDSAPSSPKSFE